jgi:glutamate dehydrogenase/leucine dehydrogenase
MTPNVTTFFEIDHQTVLFTHPSGLQAIAVIADTTLGPALSPLGVQNVTDQQAAAIARKKGDALAIKCALHDVGHGGGCVVVMADPATVNRQHMQELAAAVCDHYAGCMVVGQDVGVSAEDMAAVASMVKEKGTVAYHPDVDHAAVTAKGVRMGIDACLSYYFNGAGPMNPVIVVQGMGKVGQPLVEELRNHVSSEVHYADRHDGATADPWRVPANDVYKTPCDVLSPCISEVGKITVDVVEKVQCKIIAGSSNVQFANENALWQAHDRGILHAPDPVINGGGVIAATQHTQAEVDAKLARIPATLKAIFDQSARDNRPPMLVAQDMGREIIRKANPHKRGF